MPLKYIKGKLLVIMDKLYEKAETGCCPRFDPKPWQNKEVTWKNKLFLKDHVKSFLHIPLNMGKVMIRDMEMITKADALSPKPLMLSDNETLWGSDIHIAVSKPVPKAEMEKISGTFLTKVFEGDYNNVGKWAKEMEKYVKSKKKVTKKLYFSYTTCPACAKYYGKNYVILLAKIK